MNLPADDPLSLIIPGRLVPDDSGSEASFQTLVQWLEKCRSNHRDCNWKSDNILPLRVIDIGSGVDSTDPRLLVTTGQRGEWVALSHCWGTYPPLTTTVSTLKLHEEGIPTASLPPTFRDAMILSRELGFRYLWIDSMCIIQDSYEDWISESSKMTEVYSGASIVISAPRLKTAEVGYSTA